jgi:hypothetical protein
MKPIGQIIRERKRIEEARKNAGVVNQPVQTLSIEEQIRLLEEQVSDSDSESDSDSDDSDSNEELVVQNESKDDDNSDLNELPDNMTYERDEKGNIIRIISKIYEEKIDPLSAAYLPQPMCSKVRVRVRVRVVVRLRLESG